MAKVKPFQSISNQPPVERLSAEELALLNDLRADADQAQAVLNRFTQGLARKHRLDATARIDVTTGIITRTHQPEGNG